MSESESTRQAWNVLPPTGSATPGQGVTCLATSTTASTVDLFDANGAPYKGFFNRYLTITAEGADVYVLFDNAAGTVISQSVSHATSLTSATTTAVPAILKDGVSISVRLDPNTHRYLHLKAASGTPVVRIYPSSQPSTGYAY